MPALPYKGSPLSSAAAHQWGIVPADKQESDTIVSSWRCCSQSRLPVATKTAGAPGYAPGARNHASSTDITGKPIQSAFWDIFIYSERYRYRYLLISGNKPTRANYCPFYCSFTGPCLTCCLYCFTKQSPGKERVTIPRREQHLGVKSFLVMLLLLLF